MKNGAVRELPLRVLGIVAAVFASAFITTASSASDPLPSFFASKLWASTAARPVLAAHLKSLKEFPPLEGADTLSMRKAVEAAMKKLENPHVSSN